ncbi:MAG: elongation factor Tu [Mycobacteriaceae bacterium]|jgi:translation elongation factor EF-Tu-like GTPase|nr:elongation factor Tu [Mycobacteriaceae bacterium]
MTVEDVFAIKNRGVVATGRVESGTLRVGDTVQINGGPGVEVTAIEKFRKQLDEASAGENVGVLMKGIERNQLDRGDVLTSSAAAAPTYGEAPPI